MANDFRTAIEVCYIGLTSLWLGLVILAMVSGADMWTVGLRLVVMLGCIGVVIGLEATDDRKSDA